MTNTTAVTRIDVFFVPEWDVWSITSFDAQGDQVGESDYAPRKNAALREARILRATPETKIRLYTRDFCKYATK